MNQRTLTVTQLRRLEEPHYSVPLHVSPDGARIALTVKRDASEAELPDVQGFTLSGLPSTAVGSRVLVVNTAMGTVEEPFSTARTSWGGQWSPDGTMLAAYVQQHEEPPGLGIWHRATGAVRQLPVSVRPFFGFEVPRWTPDSRSVIVKLKVATAAATRPAADPGARDDPSAIRVFSFDPAQPEPAETPPDTTEAPTTLPSWAHRYRCDLAQVLVHTGDVTVLARDWPLIGWEVAPDGHAVAVLRYTGYDQTKEEIYYDLTTVPLAGSTSTPTVLAQRIPQEYGIKLSWSPDSRALAYISRETGRPRQLWVVPADGSGEPTNLAAGEDLGLAGDYDIPLWGADGERIYCRAWRGYWECAADGSSRRWIAASTDEALQAEFERWVQRPRGGLCWQTQHKTVLQLIQQPRTKDLLLTALNLTSGQTEVLAALAKGYVKGPEGMEVAPDGSAAYLLLGAVDHPPELWQFRDGFRKAQRLVSLNPEIDETALGMSKVVTWRGADGAERQGTLLLPPQFVESQPLPTIVEVYGGSEGYGLDHHVFGVSDGLVHGQLLASRGYAVFWPDMPMEERDPRRQMPGLVLPAINRLIDLGIADPQRLGVMGNSFGSYCALSLLTQTDRFQAAAISAVYANLTSVYGALDEHGHSEWIGWCESGQVGLGGSLWERRDAYIENSPLFYLDRVTTPLLIGSGTLQAEEAAQAGEVFSALRRLGKRVELRLYEGMDHAPPGWSEPSHCDFVERVVQWFDTYLQGS